jgi:hypothetical protein
MEPRAQGELHLFEQLRVLEMRVFAPAFSLIRVQKTDFIAPGLFVEKPLKNTWLMQRGGPQMRTLPLSCSTTLPPALHLG